MNGRDGAATASDEALVEQTRAGDQRAFGELWRRHYRSGTRVARQFTWIDADDLVSESYTRIFQRVRAGGGPTGAFRPYLYTTIRNLAASWGAARRDVNVDDMTAFEDPDTFEDPATIALDRTLTARAFRSLPERWQTVLWYTEIEGMDPHEIAPLMAMTANGVAALSYRAREGLRKAWLQAHISDAAVAPDCAWALSRMGDRARGGLGARDGARMAAHLEDCATCSIISEEVEEVGSRLALVMIPLILGGAAGGTFLASFGPAPSAVAASASVPALPEAITAGAGAVAAGGAGLFGAATAPVALVGGLAIALAATTGGVLALAPSPDDPTSASQQAPAADPSVATSDESLTDPSAIPGDGLRGIVVEEIEEIGGIEEIEEIEGVVGGVVDDVGGLVDSVVGTVTGGEPPAGHTAPGGVVGADVALNLAGTGTPGAHLSLQAAGQVYATATVAADGTFVLNVTGIPGGLSSLDLVQTVDRSYLANLVGGGGLLGGILGTLDELIDALIQPVQLGSGGSAITINPIG